MPYMPPATVIEQLSAFMLETLQDELDEDSAFLRAQVGSMSSTLGLLSQEIRDRPAAIERQRSAVIEALDDLGTLDAGQSDRISTLQNRMESVDTSIGNEQLVAQVVRETMSELQAAIASGKFGSATPEARQILHELMETRVQAQLSMLRQND